MNKFTEFYEKVLDDETAKSKLAAILGGKPVDQASDEMLEKVGALAKELGYDFTIEEAKDYLHPADGEISDDDLDEVAGGSSKPKHYDPLSNNIIELSIQVTSCGGSLGNTEL